MFRAGDSLVGASRQDYTTTTPRPRRDHRPQGNAMNDPQAGHTADSGAIPTPSPPAVPRLAPACSSTLTVPPGYEILGEIGHGGMGIVYRARDCTLDRAVALKYMLAGYTPDSAAVARFLHEARVTARLQHPGIPPVHQVGTLPDGRPFLAMKLIEGHTLHDLLKEQGPGAARWLGVFESVCQAVGYAHSQGVIHRDLK